MNRLDDLRVIVTRSADQATGLSDRLRELGAEPIEIPTIAIVEPADGGRALNAAVGDIGRYRRVVVASPNAARALSAATGESVGAAELPPVACVGQATAASLGARFVVDRIADRAIAESLVEVIGAPDEPGAAILVVSAEVTRPVLVDGLTAAGWSVDRVVGYRTVDAAVDPGAARRAAQADIVTFTSSSTAERYLRLVGPGAVPPAIACIGPITAATVAAAGHRVDVVADPHTIDGLVAALVAWKQGS